MNPSTTIFFHDRRETVHGHVGVERAWKLFDQGAQAIALDDEIVFGEADGVATRRVVLTPTGVRTTVMPARPLASLGDRVACGSGKAGWEDDLGFGVVISVDAQGVQALFPMLSGVELPARLDARTRSLPRSIEATVTDEDGSSRGIDVTDAVLALTQDEVAALRDGAEVPALGLAGRRVEVVEAVSFYFGRLPDPAAGSFAPARITDEDLIQARHVAALAEEPAPAFA